MVEVVHVLLRNGHLYLPLLVETYQCLVGHLLLLILGLRGLLLSLLSPLPVPEDLVVFANKGFVVFIAREIVVIEGKLHDSFYY